MLLFRQILIAIRTQYIYNRARLFIVAGASTMLMLVITNLLDIFLPWEPWGMILRTIALIPTSLSIFLLGYSSALAYHFTKSKDPAWASLREKFSPTWRQRISMIVGAVLLVLVYAIGLNPGYTFTSSLIVACIIGLFAFMRKTSTEINREELGIPDARDAALNTHLRRSAAKNSSPAAKEKSKADEKAKARIEKARVKLAKAEAELEAPEAPKK